MLKFRVILTCDRKYDTFDMKKRKINIILQISFRKKTLTNLREGQSEAKLSFKKMFLILKYQTLFTFFVKNPNKKISRFSWCFHMESPTYN